MVLTAWIIGFLVLPVRALFVKVFNEDMFEGMKNFNLEEDQNADNCLTKCYARLFREEIEEKEVGNDDKY